MDDISKPTRKTQPDMPQHLRDHIARHYRRMRRRGEMQPPEVRRKNRERITREGNTWAIKAVKK